MEEIAIPEFKAKCLAIMERVTKTKKPVRIFSAGGSRVPPRRKLLAFPDLREIGR